MARLIKTAFLEDDVITSGKIADGAVVAAALGSGAVVEAKIGSGAVTSAKIGADAVDGSKIADDAIDSEHLVDGSIDTAHVAADAITAAKIKIGYGDSLRFVNASDVEVGLSIDSDGDLVGPASTKMATQSYVSTAISNLVDGAPGILDTLSEIAESLNNDSDLYGTLTGMINTIESSAGLNSNGSYTSVSGTYLGAETSLRGGLVTLDSALNSAVTSLTSSISSNVTSLEGKVDTIESSVGLAANGSFTQFSGSNYMDSATSIVGALEDLDAQAYSNAGNISTNSSNISGLSTELDSTQSGAGLNANGTYTSPGGNYLTSETSLKGGLTVLDTNLNTVEGKADRALAVVPKQDIVVISADDITNDTIAFELDSLARWHDRVVVQYGNLILIPGASYDFTVASNASTQATTVTLSTAYEQAGGKPLSQGDVLVIRYDYDSSFTYA